jgi:hypothetical protein
VVAIGVAWALILVGGIVWSARRGPPTAREQTTVAQARPVVDLASARIAAAAAADDAAVAVSGFERADACSVTAVRSGARYQRVVTVAVATGAEEAVLRRVAAGLPAAYKAAVTTVTGLKLRGDAGLFVALTGTVSEPGRVRFVADTGDCRPEGDPLPADAERPRSAPHVDDAFARLRVAPQTWARHEIACPDGGTMSTVEASGPDNELPVDAIDAGMGRRDGLVVATADLYAYRAGTSDVIVRIEGSRLVVSATTRCAD